MSESDIVVVADAFEPKYSALLRAMGSLAANSYLAGGEDMMLANLKKAKAAMSNLMAKNHMVAIPRGAKGVLIKKKAKARVPGYMSIDDPDEDQVSKIAADFLKKNGNRADGVSDTTISLARQTVASGIEAGMTPHKIAGLLRDTVGGTMSDYRARMIARTETAAAYNFANLEMATSIEESTGKLNKVWVAASDERVRESHAEADGQSVALDEAFEIGSSSMQHPGDPNGDADEVINCRCTMIYEPVED